jgi:hypothetical protein
VEVVGDASLLPGPLLDPALELRYDQSGNQAADAPAVDAEDAEPVGRLALIGSHDRSVSPNWARPCIYGLGATWG